MPLDALLKAHTDWKSPGGASLPTARLLVKNCRRGTWADTYFIAAIKSRNKHSAQLFETHLTSQTVHSDALQELTSGKSTSLDGETLSMAQYLLAKGARGAVIERLFIQAAQSLNYEWMRALKPYFSNRSVELSAFDLLVNREKQTSLSGVRLELTQYLLAEGIRGPVVDKAFMRAASGADIVGMKQFVEFVTSKDSFSQCLDSLTQNRKLFLAENGIASVLLLIDNGASELSVANAARLAAREFSVKAVEKIVSRAPRADLATHAAFEGLVAKPKFLSSIEGRAVLFLLIKTGLNSDDTEHIACLAAHACDLPLIKSLVISKKYKDLHNLIVTTINRVGVPWLSSNGIEMVEYLVRIGVSADALRRLFEVAGKSLHLQALQMLVNASEEHEHAVTAAFKSAVASDAKWTSSNGLLVIEFLLQHGAHGVAIDDAAAYAAKTSNYDALDCFLKSPAAATAIPAAFKALTRNKTGQLSSKQLTIAATLVQQGVSTEILAIAGTEMANILDLEGLKVLSQSSRFTGITDEVLRALFLDEELWRTSEGLHITQYLLEKGVSSSTTEVIASKAAAALDIDVLRNILEHNTSASVVESAFTSMTALDKGWLCPEGLRIAESLLQYSPQSTSIPKAFIQSSQYLHFDAMQLLHPYVHDFSTFSESMHRVVEHDAPWQSKQHVVNFLLESGVEGEPVEFAFIEGARGYSYDVLDLLAPRIERPEVFSKAFAAASGQPDWRHYLDVVEFLLAHGATGESIDQAYIAASGALDFPAVTLLKSHVVLPETATNAFRAATKNKSWLSPKSLTLIEYLLIDNPVADVSEEAIATSLEAAANAFNVDVVRLLSPYVDDIACSKAFTAATCDSNAWTTAEGTTVVLHLAQSGASGDAVEAAFINSAGLIRYELVEELSKKIDKNRTTCIELAFNALLSPDARVSATNTVEPWLHNSDALNILQILLSMGAKGQAAHRALILAAQSADIQAVELLAQVVDHPATFNEAFQQMAEADLWLVPDNYELVATILTRSEPSEVIDMALVKALHHVVAGTTSTDLIELLLQSGANVNFDQSECLQYAARHGEIVLFRMLLSQDPGSFSLYMGLRGVLNSDLDEETVIQLFNSVTENEALSFKPDVNHSSELKFPLIFLCLINYPHSTYLIDQICQLDADLTESISWEIYKDEKGGQVEDWLQPLHLALEEDCSDEVVNILLTYGGKYCSSHCTRLIIQT